MYKKKIPIDDNFLILNDELIGYFNKHVIL